jgi:hypothetical protein
MANGTNKNKRANNKKNKKNRDATASTDESQVAAGGGGGGGRTQRQSRKKIDPGPGGLDCDRDTDDQVETMLRFFPSQLKNDGSRGGGGISPGSETPTIYHQLYKGDAETLNLKAIPFIPVMVALGFELNEAGFQPEERGGLLSTLPHNPWNMLQLLVICFDKSETYKRDKEYHEAADTKLCGVLQKLVEKDMLKKEDVLDHNLVMALCANSYAMPYFPKKRFQFLIEMDPTALTKPCFDPVIGSHPYFLPIHYCSHRNKIEAFSVCFLEGMKYYPNKLGFVFHKSHNNDFADTNRLEQAKRVGIDKTPFEMACDQYGKKRLSKIIYNRLTKSISADNDNDDDNNNNNKDNDLNSSIESLFVSLATGDSDASAKIDFQAVDLFLGNYPDAKRQLKEIGTNPDKVTAINARALITDKPPLPPPPSPSPVQDAAEVSTAAAASASTTTTATTSNDDDKIDDDIANLKISGTAKVAATEEMDPIEICDGNDDEIESAKLAAAAKTTTNYIHDYLLSGHIMMAYDDCNLDDDDDDDDEEEA